MVSLEAHFVATIHLKFIGFNAIKFLQSENILVLTEALRYHKQFSIDLARNGNSGCANEILGCAKYQFWWKSPWKWKNLGNFRVCNWLNCLCKTQVHGWLAKTMQFSTSFFVMGDIIIGKSFDKLVKATGVKISAKRWRDGSQTQRYGGSGTG